MAVASTRGSRIGATSRFTDLIRVSPAGLDPGTARVADDQHCGVQPGPSMAKKGFRGASPIRFRPELLPPIQQSDCGPSVRSTLPAKTSGITVLDSEKGADWRGFVVPNH